MSAKKVNDRDIDRFVAAFGTVILAARQLRVYMAQHSILFFAWYYLGIVMWPHQVKWATTLIKKNRHLILAPASHGKTEVASKILVLWMIIRNRNIRILLVSADQGLANKNAMLVREILESNKRLKRDFGSFHSRNRQLCKVWQQSMFQVIRDKQLKEATVEAIGITETVTGGRFDLIILDDVIDAKRAHSKAWRLTILREIRTTLIPRLEPNGSMWAIGTRKHFNDPYGNLMSNPEWTHTHEMAILEEPADFEIQHLIEPWYDEEQKEHFQRVIIRSENRGRCLCEEKWPMERLLLLRVEIGSVVFNSEYQNIIVDDETALFPRAKMEACRDFNRSWIHGVIPDEVRAQYDVILVGCDPSLVTNKKEAEAANSSNMVQYAIGLTRQRRRDLLAYDVFRGISTQAKLDRVKTFYSNVIGANDFYAMESNSFGSVYIEMLVTQQKLKIIRHHTGNNKQDLYKGVPALSVLFENGAMSIPYKDVNDQAEADELMNELHSFGLSELNDRVMALWIANSTCERWLLGQEKLRKLRKGKEAVRS